MLCWPENILINRKEGAMDKNIHKKIYRKTYVDYQRKKKATKNNYEKIADASNFIVADVKFLL